MKRWQFVRTWHVTDADREFELNYNGYGFGYETVSIDGVECARRTGWGVMSQQYVFTHYDHRFVISVALPWWGEGLALVSRLKFVRVEIDGHIVYQEGKPPMRPLPETRSVLEKVQAPLHVRSIMRRGEPRKVSQYVALVGAIVAGIVLITCAAVHCSTFFGVDLIDEFPMVWSLHVITMGMFIFAACCSRKHSEVSKDSKHNPFPHAPTWMKALTSVLFAYAFINFAAFMFRSSEGTPEHRNNGTYAIMNHGEFVREIDEHEFHLGQARVIRLFSGHWMMFNAAAMSMLCSKYRSPSADGALSKADDQPMAVS
ncbi:MAG: hypothetical protein H6817_11710 [Phycisphaerales bacterium]|nr:hypothetical protein [Phycisphaerales bacterium]